MLLKWWLFEELWELPFLPTCDIWTFMDVTHNHLCIDFERAGQMSFPLGELFWFMAFFWYHPVANAWGWRQIIRKFSTCSAITGLLEAVPANSTVFTNFFSFQFFFALQNLALSTFLLILCTGFYLGALGNLPVLNCRQTEELIRSHEWA